MFTRKESEVWLEVPGYEGRYLISDKGRFRITAPFCRSNGKPQKIGTKFGDKRLSLIRENDTRRVHISVLVLEISVGPKPEGLSCLHWNDDRSDNSLANLRWGNHSENGKDRFRNGGIPTRGEKQRSAKLTNEKVLEARKLYAEGWSLKSLTQRYGITHGPLSLAIRGLTWSHI